jgi:hypothetical protein
LKIAEFGGFGAFLVGKHRKSIDFLTLVCNEASQESIRLLIPAREQRNFEGSTLRVCESEAPGTWALAPSERAAIGAEATNRGSLSEMSRLQSTSAAASAKKASLTASPDATPLKCVQCSKSLAAGDPCHIVKITEKPGSMSCGRCHTTYDWGKDIVCCSKQCFRDYSYWDCCGDEIGGEDECNGCGLPIIVGMRCKVLKEVPKDLKMLRLR